MSYAQFQIIQNNHSLGITPNQDSIFTCAVIGTCTGVAAGATLRVSNQNIDAAGCGPAANCAKFLLTSGIPFLDIFGAAQLASEVLSAAALTPTRAAGIPSTGTITASGTSCDTFLVHFVCTVSGASNTAATFQSYLDDGITPVETLTGAATYTLKARSGSSSISTGITLTLATGTYNAGDVFSLSVLAPQIETTDATTGSITTCNALAIGKGNYNFIVVANTANQSATDATNFAGCQAILSKIVSFAAADYAVDELSQWVHHIPIKHDLTDEHDATFTGNLSALTAQSDRLAIGTGYFLSASNGTYMQWIPTAWDAVRRILQNNNPSRSIYEQDQIPVNAPGILSASVNGCLRTYTGVQQYGITYDARLAISGNDGLSSPLGFLEPTSDRFGPQPIQSQFYFVAGNAKTSNTSDYFEWERSVIADVFFYIGLAALAAAKGKTFWAKGDGTGRIRPNDADSIENVFDSAIEKGMVEPGWLQPPGAGKKFITIDRTANFASTRSISGKATFAAPNWLKKVVINFSFSL